MVQECVMTVQCHGYIEDKKAEKRNIHLAKEAKILNLPEDQIQVILEEIISKMSPGRDH